MSRSRLFTSLLFLVFILWFFSTPSRLHAQQTAIAVQEARQRMETAAKGAVEIMTSTVTGLATFVASAPGKPIPLFMSATAPPEARSRKFLESYGRAFGILDSAQVQMERMDGPDEVGMEHVRFRQKYRGVSVPGGELIVHLQGAAVKAVTAKTLPDLDAVEVKPTILPSHALSIAREVLAKHLRVTDAVLSTPRLEIFNRGIFENRQAPTRLAWFIEATKVHVREFIWIDARQGGVLLHFSQLAHARVRRIYNAKNGATGTLARSEGGAASGDSDVDNAYDFSGDTYNYFFTHHGRDSYNGAGAPLISTVRYCPSSTQCPFKNAFWNGRQLIYGEGFPAADDVTAHELTHAVIEKSTNLALYMQSGALNESFSDIFGESVDLMNAKGTDTPAVRWQIGENLPSSTGVLRNMRNPTLFGDPGKVSDPQFVCNNPGLNRGVSTSTAGYRIMPTC